MRYTLVSILAVLLLSTSLFAFFSGKGKLSIQSNIKKAFIFVNGKKKAMTGQGYTDIILDEGEYTITVKKTIDKHSYYFAKEDGVFIGADTSTKLDLKLSKISTKTGQAIKAKSAKPKVDPKIKKIKHYFNMQSDYTRIDSKKVVKDHLTGLMWQDNNPAKTIEKPWSSAKSYCSKLKLAGHSDWRLPNIRELLSIVDTNKYKPAIYSSFQNVSSDWYWTSTTSADYSSSA